MEYTSGSSSWLGAIGRARAGLSRRRRIDRRRGWSLLTPAVALLGGMLFTTTANTAAGTELRNDRRPELTNLIAERKKNVADAEARFGDLRRDIDDQTQGQAGSDQRVDDQRRRGAAEGPGAGLTKLHGPGVLVRLDDLVVHQQDVQAAVNALWAGGAEAMSIMDVRVISTSAVRCVGNTLLLDGRVYSPPFEIKAIGDPTQLQRALDAAEGVRLFREAAAAYGLGYQVRVESDVAVPAYEGSTALRSAQVAQ